MNAPRRNSPNKPDLDKKFHDAYQSLRQAAMSKDDTEFSRLKVYLSFVTDYAKGESVDTPTVNQLYEEAKDTTWKLELTEKKLADKKLGVGQFKLTPLDQNTLCGVKAAKVLLWQMKTRQEQEVPFSPALRRQILGTAGIRHLSAVPLEVNNLD